MTDETENLVLEILRKFRSEMAEYRSKSREQIGDLKLRVSALEQAVAQGFLSNQTAISQMQISMGSFHRRADRIDTRTDSFDQRLDRLEETTARRLARIEERLNLTDA